LGEILNDKALLAHPKTYIIESQTEDKVFSSKISALLLFTQKSPPSWIFFQKFQRI
jgi:hypothetical protein